MPTLHSILHMVLVVLAILAFLSAFGYLRYRTGIGRWGWAFLFTLGSELSLCAFLWTSEPFDGIAVWYFLQTVSFFLLHPLWLLFVDSFSDQPSLIDKRLAFLGLSLPLGILCAVLIPALAGANLSVGQATSLATAFGSVSIIPAWVLLFNTYFSLLLILAALRVVQLFFRMKTWNDRKLFPPMLLGSFVIIVSSALEFSGNNFLAPVSIQQLALGAIGLGFYIYVYIYKFGGILPVGPENAFTMMRDAGILLDADNRVVNLNPQAEKFLNRRGRQCFNREISTILPEAGGLIRENPGAAYLAQEISRDGSGTLTELSVIRFAGINNTTTGRLVSIRDITARDQLESTLMANNHRMEQSNTLLQTLAEANLVIHATNDLDEVIAGLEASLTGVGIDFFIALADPESNELRIEYYSIKPDLVERFEKALGFQARGFTFRRNHSTELYSYLDDDLRDHFITDFTVRGDQGTLRANLLEVAYRLVGIEPDMPFVIFKLAAGAHKLGLMGLWGRGLQVDNLNPLRIFTSQVAWAFERINLTRQGRQRSIELERSNQLLTALANVSAQMGKSSESGTALEVLGQQLEELGLHCALGYVDPALDTITFRYASFEHKSHKLSKYMPGFHFIGYKLPKKLWPSQKVTREGVPVWYSDVYAIFERMFPIIPANALRLGLKQAGITNEDRLCILPLMVDGKVSGVLPIWGLRIAESDTPGLMVFAHQVAEFLRKTEGFEKETARAKDLARSNQIIIALSNVAASLETTSNIHEVFESLGQELGKVKLNCMVGTLDDEQQFMCIEYLSVSPQIFSWAEKLGAEWQQNIRVPRRLWPTERAVVERVPYWDPNPIDSVSKMFPLVPRVIFSKTFEMAGMTADDPVCYLPMIIEEKVIGILAVWGHNLEDADLPGLAVFSNQVATAIRNVTLYNQAQEEIATRREAEAKIQEALNEKEVLLREVHHRVKNNLQVISSLLNLQMTQSNDPSCAEGLRESQNRVRAMALIHEKLYQTADLARIPFSSYLESLISYLSQTYRVAHERVTFQVDVSNILLDLDTAIPCGLIINELVSNALKYAFPADSAGSIAIHCHETGPSQYTLQVVDDGVGLPAAVDPYKSNTLGLKLVFSLVRQIGGQLTVDSQHGTCFEIRFSKAPE